MRFWDSSAVVALLVRQAATARVRSLYKADPVVLVWWGTPVECESAMARLVREGGLSQSAGAAARRRLELLGAAWSEVAAGDAVRSTARRLLRVHTLRAGDALQLAAAVVAAEQRPETLELVCLDERLSEAARREGFRVLPEPGRRHPGRRGAPGRAGTAARGARARRRSGRGA